MLLWCVSTECYADIAKAHATAENFERALDSDDAAISPCMIYAYAAITEGLPFANAAPNLCVDTPALQELAREHQAPIAGKDLKTGQTLLKTILAPYKSGYRSGCRM